MKLGERGIAAEVILLISLLSGLAIAVVGVRYDHELRREEEEKRSKRIEIQNPIDWDSKRYELKGEIDL